MSKWEPFMHEIEGYKDVYGMTSRQMGIAYNLWKLLDNTAYRDVADSIDNGISYSIYCDFTEELPWPKKDNKDVYKK